MKNLSKLKGQRESNTEYKWKLQALNGILTILKFS